MVSVSVSSSTISQPCDAACVQAILNAGIFQSPISEVSARSSRVSVPPIRQHLSYTTILNSQRPTDRLRRLLAWAFPGEPRLFGGLPLRMLSDVHWMAIGINSGQRAGVKVSTRLTSLSMDSEVASWSPAKGDYDSQGIAATSYCFTIES
jgi:hypothetical protein